MSSMTKQEAIEILTEMRDVNDYITQSDALQMAIDELEKKPAASCEDAISRQAVMDGLEKYHNTDMNIDGLTYAYDLVCKLPSVSTEKTGRWIDVEGYEGLLCKCSNCCKDGERYKHRTHQSKTNFCPDCGAKMGVKE